MLPSHLRQFASSATTSYLDAFGRLCVPGSTTSLTGGRLVRASVTPNGADHVIFISKEIQKQPYDFLVVCGAGDLP